LRAGNQKPDLNKIKMNHRNHKSVVRNVVAFSLILALAGLLGSCKAREKCPAYGNAQPAKHSALKNS
jgi:hypothetical protein